MTNNRLSLKAEERTIVGKKVKKLREQGITPAHVFGKGHESESVSIASKDLLPVLHQAGETGLIDLKIGEEKVRPVMVRGVSYDPVKGSIQNVDFYQVNLKEKVSVPVPLVLIEPEEPAEVVKLGEAMVLQTMSDVYVEALPTDLVDQIEVDIRSLKNIDDAITIGDLSYNHDLLTIQAEPEDVVVKIAPVVIEAEAEPVPVEGEEGIAGEASEEDEGTEGESENVEGTESNKEEAEKDKSPE